MYHKSEQGFTLIELILVILIIGLLLAIAIPSIFAIRRSNREKQETKTAEAALSFTATSRLTSTPLRKTPTPLFIPVQPLSITLTSVSMDAVYFGPCTGKESSTVDLKGMLVGNIEPVKDLAIEYTFSDSSGTAVTSDTLSVLLLDAYQFEASFDVDSEAPAALGEASGRIGFIAQALDGSGLLLAQSEVLSISIVFCTEPGITVVSHAGTPTFTPTLHPALIDSDGDGYDQSVDCDDNDAKIHPGAFENDNGVDDNCDGQVDEGLDADGDGYTPIYGGDCDDTNAKTYPGAPEYEGDGIDSNCNGDDNSFLPNHLWEAALLLKPHLSGI